MKKLIPLYSCLLLGSPFIYAADTVTPATGLTVYQSTLAADTTTEAAPDRQYVQLENLAHLSLLKALTPTGTVALTQNIIDRGKQSHTQADLVWLKNSHYNFQTQANQQADIDLLKSFSTLPANVIKANLDTVTAINHDATLDTKHLALQDGDGINFLYFAADAMGPKLGTAFIKAYDKGEMGKAAALIKHSEVNTRVAKVYFNNPRPFLIPGNAIHFVPDDWVAKDNHLYPASEGSFPSGHTNVGYTDVLLLAAMLPERYDTLVERGARYGYSRLVLGVHYPLDVMGSRMIAQRNVAHYLNDPAYQHLFVEAKQQLRAALVKECGMSIHLCAQSSAKNDPWQRPPVRQLYSFTMTYHLPVVGPTNRPIVVPQGAEVLLADALPKLSAEKRRELLAKTAIPSGQALSGTTDEQQFWQRIDLPAAYALGMKESRNSKL